MDENKKPFSDLAETIKKNTAPKIEKAKAGDLKEAPFAIIPEGMKAESVKKYLEEYRERPERRKGTIKATRVKSFVEIVNRFKNKESVLFAGVSVGDQRIDANITAIFDYHPAGEKNEDADNCEHRAKYGFPISKAFKNWLEQNTSGMSQIDFAYFLEKRINELSAPTDADKALIEGLKPKFADPINMLELSRDLEIYSNESFVSRNKTSSGEMELKFTNQHIDGSGKPIKIPDFFVINVPVFEGGSNQRILAHLRYRKKDAQVIWFYELYNIDEMLHEAFETACEEVQKEVDIPLFHGSDS